MEGVSARLSSVGRSIQELARLFSPSGASTGRISVGRNFHRRRMEVEIVGRA
jgi:hypothetical protein